MRILSLDGGGFLGLATASFLESTEHFFGTTCHDRIDFFAGTSTGAIIALALASGMTAKEVATLYADLGARVFRQRFRGGPMFRFCRDLFRARHDNEALKGCLEDAFGDTTVDDVASKGKHLLVPAYGMTSGRPCLFKTDHSARLNRDGRRLLRDIALASAAAPAYLPPVPLKDPTTGAAELFCDGGVFANHPALLAYTEAVCELKVAPADVHILSVSTPRPDMALPATAVGRAEDVDNRWGGLRWMQKGKLFDVFINAAAMVADGTLERLTHCQPGAIYQRIELRKPDGLEMDVATREATETLRQMGCDLANQNKIREQVRPFFQ